MVFSFFDDFFPSSDYPDNLLNRVAVACEVGSGHALALLDNGEVSAWGPRYEREIRFPEVSREIASGPWPRPPSAESNSIAIAATLTSAATLQADGKILMWGPKGVITSEELKSHYPIRSIQSAGDDFLLLTSSGNVIKVVLPSSAEEKPPVLLKIAGKVSVLSSHFFYSEEQGWQSTRMPESSSKLWEACPQVAPGQISGYSISSTGSQENQEAVLWVEPK